MKNLEWIASNYPDDFVQMRQNDCECGNCPFHWERGESMFDCKRFRYPDGCPCSGEWLLADTEFATDPKKCYDFIREYAESKGYTELERVAHCAASIATAVDPKRERHFIRAVESPITGDVESASRDILKDASKRWSYSHIGVWEPLPHLDIWQVPFEYGAENIESTVRYSLDIQDAPEPLDSGNLPEGI